MINALDQLEQIIAVLSDKNATIYLDLGELPGFHYHTGVVFAAYVPGHGKALGNGGRYDHVGESFGRSRPATGFAFDLKSLVDKVNWNLKLQWVFLFLPIFIASARHWWPS